MINPDGKVPGCNVPVFQLLQWKYAIKLEAKGLKHSSGRSVSAHAKRKLGLRPGMKRQAIIAKIDEILAPIADREHEDEIFLRGTEE